jgi:hypothetical protein
MIFWTPTIVIISYIIITANFTYLSPTPFFAHPKAKRWFNGFKAKQNDTANIKKIDRHHVKHN